MSMASSRLQFHIGALRSFSNAFITIQSISPDQCSPKTFRIDTAPFLQAVAGATDKTRMVKSLLVHELSGRSPHRPLGAASVMSRGVAPVSNS